jgi:hypothetical protein
MMGSTQPGHHSWQPQRCKRSPVVIITVTDGVGQRRETHAVQSRCWRSWPSSVQTNELRAMIAQQAHAQALEVRTWQPPPLVGSGFKNSGRAKLSAAQLPPFLVSKQPHLPVGAAAKVAAVLVVEELKFNYCMQYYEESVRSPSQRKLEIV